MALEVAGSRPVFHPKIVSNMVPFSHFKQLPLMEKLLLLYHQGHPLLSIRYYKYKVTLYGWKGHFIEVFFNHCEGVVEKIAPLEQNSSRLSFYADQLQLPSNI